MASIVCNTEKSEVERVRNESFKMGLPIGQAPVSLNAVAGTRSVRSVSFFDRTDRDPVRTLGNRNDSDTKGLLGNSERSRPQLRERSELRSAPAAALDIVSRTVEDGKRLVPSISELQLGFQRQAADSRAQTREQLQSQLLGNGNKSPLEVQGGFEAKSPKRVQFRLPDPSAQARNFINALNETAGDLQAKFGGRDIAPPSTGASFQLNGENFPVRDTSSGGRLNITV
jgi:hypothetical protein